jgi:hypothetical protein
MTKDDLLHEAYVQVAEAQDELELAQRLYHEAVGYLAMVQALPQGEQVQC